MKVNLTYLRNMAAGNKQLMIEMIEIFNAQSQEFVLEMEKLLNEKEYEQLGRLAHKAKSSISIMGMDELANNLKKFEIKAKAGEDVEEYPNFISKFKNETSEAINELSDIKENIELYI